MPEIIPAILAKNAIDFAQKLRLVEGAASRVQIDVIDGKFVSPKNWADPEIIKTIPTPIKYDLHLMVADPAAEIKKWKKIKNVKKVIFHIEVKRNHASIVKAIKRLGWQAGAALNPATPIARLRPVIKKINTVLFLGVIPGRSGQKFQPRVLKKIQDLRKISPRVTIQVDGGVNLRNAREILGAGADALCAASVIYKTGNPKKIINEFKKIN